MGLTFGIIYKVTNKINNKLYIGQTTKELDVRITQHYNKMKIEKDNCYFYNAIRKYGKENFIWEIVCECNTRKELNEKEIYYIKEYNTFWKNNGYNLTLGGFGMNGYKQTEETKEKNRQSKLGKKHTEETKQTMSTKKLGHFVSEEQKIKQSISMSGRKLSDLHKKNISDNNGYGMLGKNHTKKWCEKNIELHKKYTKEIIEQVLQYRKYNFSYNKIANLLNVSPQTIWNWCNKGDMLCI